MSVEKQSFEMTGKTVDEEPVAMATPIATVPTVAMVRVVAPATMVEGATFEAVVDGISFLVAVPEGGVEEGETFSVPYPKASRRKIPTEGPRWKHDLCGCPCSVMCFVGFLCPLVLHAQVMQRMNFTMGGCRRRLGTTNTASTNGVPIVYTLAVPYYALYALFMILVHLANINDDESTAVASILLYYLFQGWSLFCIIAMVIARRSFRQTYNLPSMACGENCCDDCVISYFCGPCSAIQMANHSQEGRPYSFCSTTGLGGANRAPTAGGYERANTQEVV